jgi:uncharacterized protein (DUF1778 family)
VARPPRAEAPSVSVHIRLSPLELRRAAEAAQRNHQQVAAFIRDAILNAAADCLEPMPEPWPRVPRRRIS